MKHLRCLLIVVPVLMAVMTSGCKEGGPGRQSYVAKPGQQLIRVAIVPFDSMGLAQENAARIVTEEIMTSLLSTGMFDVVEPGMVYMAMSEAGTRNAWGIDPATMQKLQEKLGPVRAFVVGTVQEYGEVRVGSVSYPSISISARVVEPETGQILWAGSCSRTGAESEKLFGMGAVYSSGRLARAVVRELMNSVDRERLLAVLNAAPAPPATAVVRTPTTPTASGGPTGNEKFFDEAAVVSQAILVGYLVDYDGFTKGEIDFRKHHFSMAETTYASQGLLIAAKLEDCGKKDVALARIKHEHPDETEARFAGLPAFMAASPANTPGAYHLDVAVGRFALFLTGPGSKKGDIEKVAQAIIAAMK